MDIKLLFTAPLYPNAPLARYLDEHAFHFDAVSVPHLPDAVHAALLHAAALAVHPSVFEGGHAPFPFKGINYGAAFFMATGFHGFHVIVGTIFLIVCLIRAYRGDFTPRQHFGFEAAAWYWHFVDVVWLFLFVTIYVWGGWGAPVHSG